MEIFKLPWEEVEPKLLANWGSQDGKFQAEHVAIVGPTGSGKSYFMTYLLKQRATLRGSHVVVVATKPTDNTLLKMGWPVINKWPPNYNQSQVIFWPKAGSLKESLQNQRTQILDMLDELWHKDSNIIVAFDEIAYIEDELKLSTPIKRYWREARALGISVVATTQRPVNVGRTMWSESSWTFAFKPKDEDDAKRVGQELGSGKIFIPLLMKLQRNEFIIKQRDEDDIVITKLNSPSKTTSSVEDPTTKPQNPAK